MHSGKQMSRSPSQVQNVHQNEGESDLERGMVVGARCAGLSSSQTADLLRFSCTAISRLLGEMV